MSSNKYLRKYIIQPIKVQKYYFYLYFPSLLWHSIRIFSGFSQNIVEMFASRAVYLICAPYLVKHQASLVK